LIRRAAAVLFLAACAAVPAAAYARATVSLEGGATYFFSDTLNLVARDGATLRLADGTTAHADAAYVDLRADRAVLAGHASVARGGTTAQADAIAIDLDGESVDLLDATSGVTRTTRALAPGAHAEIDAVRFAFPELDDRYAFIRSRRADITPHANVRFTPAAFPTSVGSFPVPTYLHTYATGAGFAATSLSGANFDQPYGIAGTRNALSAVHALWLDGPGAAGAFQQQLVAGDDAYVTAALQTPLRGSSSLAFNAYRRMGSRYTFSMDGFDGYGLRFVHGSLGAAFGAAGGRLDYRRFSTGASQFDASLRSPDLHLLGQTTIRFGADAGFDAQRGGLLYQLPDRRQYATVWRHGVDAFVATPIVNGPLGTKLSATFDASRTWYAFPHHYDAVSANGALSRKLSRHVTLFAGYDNFWSASIYPNAQGVFFAAPPPRFAPDGTPWAGYAAFDGAAVARAANVDLQVTPNANTSVRVSVRHYSDFLQFDGIGRPQWEARADARFRPFPNVGISIGRAYDFGWGGTRWVPRWTFGISP
jgi:hypothetical protein